MERVLLLAQAVSDACATACGKQWPHTRSAAVRAARPILTSYRTLVGRQADGMASAGLCRFSGLHARLRPITGKEADPFAPKEGREIRLPARIAFGSEIPALVAGSACNSRDPESHRSLPVSRGVLRRWRSQIQRIGGDMKRILSGMCGILLLSVLTGCACDGARLDPCGRRCGGPLLADAVAKTPDRRMARDGSRRVSVLTRSAAPAISSKGLPRRSARSDPATGTGRPATLSSEGVSPAFGVSCQLLWKIFVQSASSLVVRRFIDDM